MFERILVIDDDLSVLEMVSAALVYEGFDVKTEGRTYNVFKSIDDFKPELIILDYLLDSINGGELCHQIKSHPDTKAIPVIIISGFPRVIKSLGMYGCDSFISKPFGLDTLIGTINTCLNKREDHAEEK